MSENGKKIDNIVGFAAGGFLIVDSEDQAVEQLEERDNRLFIDMIRTDDGKIILHDDGYLARELRALGVDLRVNYSIIRRILVPKRIMFSKLGQAYIETDEDRKSVDVMRLIEGIGLVLEYFVTLKMISDLPSKGKE